MSLVTVQKLGISFLGKSIFKDVGFQISPGDRIGLLGPNGSGKTTLMRIIAGEQSYEEGEILKGRTVTVGYLPQDVEGSLQGPMRQNILDAVPGRVEANRELLAVEDELHHVHDEEEQLRLATRLAELHDEINHLDANYPPHEAERILTGLGFPADELDRDVSELSGGWRMRAALARILYLRPDVLLMDEPTNHLDIPSVHWLEGFLQGFQGAMLLVCHDRWFLNRQIKRIISFEPEGVRQYTGNYDFYLLAREEERKVLEGQARNQEQKVREAKRFIERFRFKSTKARQAQSKIKVLDKMKLIETHKEHRGIRFSFPKVPASGRRVVSTEHLAKAYGDLRLYDDLNVDVFKDERIAIIGPNGAGKTTLLRLIAGELEADGGEVSFGSNVTMSYYAQHHSEMLQMGATVVEEVHRVVPSAGLSHVRNVCGAFLFQGDDVDKPVKVLSGGEKARVALAQCLMRQANFLVMDEPTNHLDLQSSEVLCEALENFGGTVLFVSHNQSFVHRLATRIWDLRDGELVEYPGSLAEYYDSMERREKEGAIEVEEKPSVTASPSPKEKVVVETGGAVELDSAEESRRNRKEQRRLEADRRRRERDLLRPLQKKIEPLEKRISKLEQREKELELLLADPEVLQDKERGTPLFTEYGETRKKLQELLGRWEYLQEQLEEARASLDPA